MVTSRIVIYSLLTSTLRRTISVQWLARSFGTNRQTSCYFNIRIITNLRLNLVRVVVTSRIVIYSFPTSTFIALDGRLNLKKNIGALN